MLTKNNRKTTNPEKIFLKHIWLIPRIYIELLQLDRRHLTQRWLKSLNKALWKYKWWNCTWRGFNIISHKGNANQNHSECAIQSHFWDWVTKDSAFNLSQSSLTCSLCWKPVVRLWVALWWSPCTKNWGNPLANSHPGVEALGPSTHKELNPVNKPLRAQKYIHTQVVLR